MREPLGQATARPLGTSGPRRLHAPGRGASARRRVGAALAGETELSDLSDAERLVANAELDVAIVARGDRSAFEPELAAEGVTTVAVDAAGNLVEHLPDGSEKVLDAPTG